MSPPSMHLKDALQKLTGIRLLWQAHKDGRLADPFSVESELNRIECDISHVLGLLVGDIPADDLPIRGIPVVDDPTLVFARRSMDAEAD